MGNPYSRETLLLRDQYLHRNVDPNNSKVIAMKKRLEDQQAADKNMRDRVTQRSIDNNPSAEIESDTDT